MPRTKGPKAPGPAKTPALPTLSAAEQRAFERFVREDSSNAIKSLRDRKNIDLKAYKEQEARGTYGQRQFEKEPPTEEDLQMLKVFNLTLTTLQDTWTTARKQLEQILGRNLKFSMMLYHHAAAPMLQEFMNRATIIQTTELYREKPTPYNPAKYAEQITSKFEEDCARIRAIERQALMELASGSPEAAKALVSSYNERIKSALQVIQTTVPQLSS